MDWTHFNILYNLYSPNDFWRKNNMRKYNIQYVSHCPFVFLRFVRVFLYSEPKTHGNRMLKCSKKNIYVTKVVCSLFPVLFTLFYLHKNFAVFLKFISNFALHTQHQIYNTLIHFMWCKQIQSIVEWC